VGFLSKSMGELVLGRTGAPTTGALFATNAFLGSTVFSSSFVNHWADTVQGDTSMSNTVRYVSPVLGGLRTYLLYSFGEERSAPPDQDRGEAFDGRIDYAAGPWLLTLAGRQIDMSTNEDGREQTTIITGAAYDFGVVRLFGQYITVDDSFANAASDVDRKGFTAGARVPIGLGFAMASYSRSSIDDANAASPSRRTTYAVGYDYSLSKRTDIYANLLTDKLTEPTGTKFTRLGIGIRHLF
jgi:predicted porin